MLKPKPKPLTEVYDLLKRCDYPLLPDRGQALTIMQQARHITLCDGDRLVAWVGIHGNHREVAIDMCVDKAYRKRWCTPSLYKTVIDGLFAKGVEKIRAETRDSVMKEYYARLIKNKGWKAMMDNNVSEYLHTPPLVIELTREDYLGKLSMRGKSICS